MPISILPIVPKVIEKHSTKHLSAYLNTYKLLHEGQSGFRKHHSSQTALIKLTNDWLCHIDKGNIVGAIFFDHGKAFHVVDHETLLHKLAIYDVDSLVWTIPFKQVSVYRGWVENVRLPDNQKRCTLGIRTVTGSVPCIYKWHATSFTSGHRHIRWWYYNPFCRQKAGSG